MPENLYDIDTEVDRFNLDEDLEKQYNLYLSYSELSVKAIKNRDKIKQQMELVQAELDIEIRKNPTEFGLKDKPTESGIKSAIIASVKYEKAFDEYLNACEECNVYGGVLRALEHKKKALEKLSDLWIAGFYSKPNVNKEAKESSVKKTDQGISEATEQSMRLRRNKK